MSTIVNGDEFVNFRLVCRECGSTQIGERWGVPETGEAFYECGCCHKRNYKMPTGHLGDLLAIAKAVGNDFPMPTQIEGVSITDIINHLEKAEQMENNAGVAQSGERLPSDRFEVKKRRILRLQGEFNEPHQVQMTDLRNGDLFRMYESTGELVAGHSTWCATSDGKIGPAGLGEIEARAVDLML